MPPTQVTSGMDIVKQCEAVGSRDGRTSVPVIVADCGEIKGKST